jgi:hypothetical protein
MRSCSAVGLLNKKATLVGDFARVLGVSDILARLRFVLVQLRLFAPKTATGPRLSSPEAIGGEGPLKSKCAILSMMPCGARITKPHCKLLTFIFEMEIVAAKHVEHVLARRCLAPPRKLLVSAGD